MLTLLHRFAALTLLLISMHALLPDGAMRRTAMMCAGLIMTLCWLEALRDIVQLPQLDLPDSLLTSTGTADGDLTSVMEVYARQAERSGYAK